MIEEKDNCILGLKEDIEKRNQHNIENLFETFDNENYFKGLSLKEVFELAKKSIRLTKENSELRDKLEGEMQENYFEYCLTNLTKDTNI